MRGGKQTPSHFWSMRTSSPVTPCVMNVARPHLTIAPSICPDGSGDSRGTSVSAAGASPRLASMAMPPPPDPEADFHSQPRALGKPRCKQQRLAGQRIGCAVRMGIMHLQGRQLPEIRPRSGRVEMRGGKLAPRPNRHPAKVVNGPLSLDVPDQPVHPGAQVVEAAGIGNDGIRGPGKLIDARRIAA